MMIGLVSTFDCLQVHVMLRPRAGDFYYTDDELHVLLLDCQQLKQCRIAGFVFGCLSKDGSLDQSTAQRVLKACHPFPVTFHRAIDVSSDIIACAQQAVALGFKRILTSGGCNTAMAGSDAIAALQRAVGDQTIVMAASGIDESNAVSIVQATGVSHLHASLRHPLNSRMTHRVEAVSMGSPLQSEYNLKQASQERVQKVVTQLGQLHM
jgi:copper homeostasis protein